MKVYIVGHHGPEHNTIISVHKTHKGAMVAWNKVRIELLGDAKQLAKGEKHDKEMWRRIIKNLSCKNPETIDNYPHETPYVHEYEVVE